MDCNGENMMRKRRGDPQLVKEVYMSFGMREGDGEA